MQQAGGSGLHFAAGNWIDEGRAGAGAAAPGSRKWRWMSLQGEASSSAQENRPPVCPGAARVYSQCEVTGLPVQPLLSGYMFALHVHVHVHAALVSWVAIVGTQLPV